MLPVPMEKCHKHQLQEQTSGHCGSGSWFAPLRVKMLDEMLRAPPFPGPPGQCAHLPSLSLSAVNSGTRGKLSASRQRELLTPLMKLTGDRSVRDAQSERRAGRQCHPRKIAASGRAGNVNEGCRVNSLLGESSVSLSLWWNFPSRPQTFRFPHRSEEAGRRHKGNSARPHLSEKWEKNNTPVGTFYMEL